MYIYIDIADRGSIVTASYSFFFKTPQMYIYIDIADRGSIVRYSRYRTHIYISNDADRGSIVTASSKRACSSFERFN